MLQLLRQHFPGGYLVRGYASELRYIAAFASPVDAAAWSLTVQVSQPTGRQTVITATGTCPCTPCCTECNFQDKEVDHDTPLRSKLLSQAVTATCCKLLHSSVLSSASLPQ